jgi:O-antigen ligase
VEACRTRCAAGAGLGNFPEAFNQAYPFSAASKNIGLNQAAHNVYLGIAVEMGLGGLTLFLLAILAEWRALTRTPLRERAPGLRAALLGLLTVNVFLSAIWFKYFWLPFLLIRVAESALAPRKAELPASVPGLTPAPTAL